MTKTIVSESACSWTDSVGVAAFVVVLVVALMQKEKPDVAVAAVPIVVDNMDSKCCTEHPLPLDVHWLRSDPTH